MEYILYSLTVSTSLHMQNYCQHLWFPIARVLHPLIFTVLPQAAYRYFSENEVMTWRLVPTSSNC